MIKIGFLADENKNYLEPDARAAIFGHAGLDYYRASVLANEYQWQEHGLPLFYFLLPTMHQTIELITKGIAYKVITSFDPKKYSHRALSLMKAHANDIPVFASILQDPNNTELLDGLEKSYFGVRYGECTLSYDGDAWLRYVAIAQTLFNDLSARTGLRFPYGSGSHSAAGASN